MQFGFGILERHKGARRRSAGDIEARDYVVARHAEGAPWSFIFFDGSETRVEGAGDSLTIMPGGAFFLDEARPYATLEEARAIAERLNDTSPCPDRPWMAVKAERVRVPD